MSSCALASGKHAHISARAAFVSQDALAGGRNQSCDNRKPEGCCALDRSGRTMNARRLARL